MDIDDFADQMAAYEQERYEVINKNRADEEQRKIALAIKNERN